MKKNALRLLFAGQWLFGCAYLFFFSMIFFGNTQAQTAKVSSKSYQLLLKTLLAHSVPEISVTDVPVFIKQKENVILLDAREKREYEVSHLKNAIWVGYDQLDLTALSNTPKHQPILVYCSVGYRSEKVAEKLIKQGFNNVQNIYGGIFEWKNQGHEVITTQGKTDEVHAYNKTWGVWLNKGKKIYK
jgi:rhodanese-related sulfurtransferase